MRVRSDVTHVIVRRTENDFLFETIMYDPASETDTRQAGRWASTFWNPDDTALRRALKKHYPNAEIVIAA